MAKGKPNKSKLIPAIGYVRKSTAGQTNGKERQEKSIDQQRREIEAVAKQNGYKIIRWYEDAGVSGWKRDGKRPGFDRMLSDAKTKADFQAVLCDDLDRFSRAEVMEVFSDLSTLASAGVKTIHCVNQGSYGLGENDIGRIIKMVVDVHGGNEFSRKLGRRVALAKRNKAAEGKRSGSKAPFGMENDGNGGLVHADPHAVETVRWIFAQFVNQAKSLRWITLKLNEAGTPAPQGETWYPDTVKKLLKQSAYRGDFSYGNRPTGRFYHTSEDGEVVESNGETAEGTPAFTHEAVYEPIIDPKVFKKAQKRLEGFKAGRKPRHDSYALSRILVCDHCGRPMYGTTRSNGTVIYKCGTALRKGDVSCQQYTIRQDKLLPAVVSILDEEIDALTAATFVNQPPQPEPETDHTAEIEALQAKIAKSEERILEIEDKRTRQSLDRQISEMRNELERLQADQNDPAKDAEAEAEAVASLKEWWQAFQQHAVNVDLAPGSTIARTTHPDTSAYIEAWGDTSFAANLDRRALNEALHGLGCEIRLRWTTEQAGKRRRHTLEKGRFRLGQRDLELVPSETQALPCMS